MVCAGQEVEGPSVHQSGQQLRAAGRSARGRVVSVCP